MQDLAVLTSGLCLIVTVLEIYNLFTRPSESKIKRIEDAQNNVLARQTNLELAFVELKTTNQNLVRSVEELKLSVNSLVEKQHNLDVLVAAKNGGTDE